MSILKQVLQVFLFLSLLSSTFAFSLSALSTISDTIDSFLSENSLSLNSSIEESNLLLEEKKALRSQRLALLLEHQKENAKTKSLEKAETATVLTTKEKKALSALSFVSEKALESLGSKEADKEQNYVFVSTDDKGRLTLERFKGNKTLFFEKLYKGDIQAIFENEVYTSQAYDQAKEIAQYDDFLRSYPSSGGSGVKVAVLDSGTEDLSFQVVFTQDFTNSSTGTKDIFGHGKYVEDLLLSFAPDVSVYSMKVLDDTGVGDSFAVYEAIETAIQEGVDIISLSFGKTENDSLVQGIIEQALEEDILLVAAAGNCRQGCGDFSGVLFPASMQDVIAVGSISPQIEPSSFSSSQDFVSYTKPDLVAVGEDLGTPTGKLVQGTSFAVPQVSAALALRLQDRNLSVAQVFDLLSVSSTDLGERGKDLDFGFGLLNVGGIFGLETQFNLSTYQNGQKQSEESPFIFQSNIFTGTFPVHENATLWFSFSPVANASTNPSIVFKVRDLEKKTVILDQFSLNQSYNFSYTYTPETVEDILPSLWFSVDGNEYYLSPLYKIRGDEEVFVNFDSAPEHFWKNESLDVQLSITNMANHSLPLEVKLEFEGQVPNTTFSPASVTIEVPTGQSTANLSFSLDFIENMTLNGKVFTRHNNRDYVQTSPNSSFVSTLRTPQTVFVSHFVHEEILPFGGILNIYGVLENAENFTSFCVVSFEIFDVNNESLDESRVGYVPVSSPKLFNKAYRLSPLFVAGTYSLETRFSCEEQEFTLSSSFSVGETNTSFENLSNDYAQTLANLLGSSGLNEKDFLQTQVLSYNEHTLLEEVARSYVAQLVDEDDFVECDFATNAEGNARCTYAVYRNGVIKNEVGKTSLDTEKNALGAAGVYIQELNRNYFGTAFTLNYGYNALAFDWQTHGETCPSNLSGTCALSSYELRSSKGTELLGLSTTVPYVQVETTELGSSYLATSGEFQLEISSVGQSTISSSDHKTYSIISRSQKIGLECVSDYTCSNGRSCVAYENQTGKGTSCQCTQISALIQSCLSEKTGAYCDGNVECESGICENNVCSSGTICYRDADGDGYGSVFSTALSSSGSCGSINGLTYVKNSDDCDDSSSAKTTYKQLYRDADGDGYPGTLSFVCSSGTSTPSGYSSSNTDCDDGTSSLSAYVHEDTRWYEDADKDGFPREGSIIITCERPSANFYPDEYLVAQKSFWSSVLDLESDCNDEEFNSENECVDTNMCPNGRDGSSRACSCSSDNQCNGQTPFCVNLPNQFGYCWYDKSVLSECESENSFSCSANTLYRCVNDGSGKLVKKAELFCSANYACSADQGRCVLANGYSIRLDYSLEQQNVYKKHGSSFVARLQIEGTAYGSPLVYDTNVFSSECPSGSPISGSYKECLFTVKSSAETGETLIKHGPAIATINILDDSEPAVNLYLTHSERMIQEYGEDSRDTVDLIVTKLYGKAAKEKGIVMDLAAYEKTGDFDAPYASMHEYLNDIRTKGGRGEIDNYVDEVAGRVRLECAGCENVLIVGSDFVVPGARDEYTFGNVYGFGSEEKAYMTSDAVYATNTYADLSFAELESYFSATNPSGSPAAKNVIFSLPLGWTKDTPEFQELITVLDELHNNGSIFYDVHAVYEYDDVSCNDYWDLEDGTLIIIGNISNNRLFSCYHNENYEIGEGLMALDRNLWADKSEVALLVNDVGLENVIKILETGEYKNLEGTTYNILFWTNKARGYINVLPVAGLAINFFITDTIEDLVLTGDSCVHSFDGDAAAIDCAVSLGVSAVDYVTFKTFSKSGVGKGAKKLAREAVEDTVDVAEYVAFSNKVKLITRSKYSKELSEYFNSCLLYEGFTSAGYESQSTKRCLYEPDINLMAKEDIEVLEKYLKKSQDGFGTGENKVIALFSTKKADFSFSVVADDFQISEASVLRFGNKNVGYQHFKKHIEVPEDFTKKKPKTTFIRVINGEERYMTTQDVMDRIAYAFKNGKEDEQLSTEKTLVIRTYDKDSYSKYREYLTVIIRESGEVLTTYPDHKTTR